MHLWVFFIWMWNCLYIYIFSIRIYRLCPTWCFSGIDQFKQQFDHLEDRIGKAIRSAPLIRRYASLPRWGVIHVKLIAGYSIYCNKVPCFENNFLCRERVCTPIDEDDDENSPVVRRACLPSPPKENIESESGNATTVVDLPNYRSRQCCSARCMLRSASISASKCIEVKGVGCEVSVDLGFSFKKSSILYFY